MLTAQQTLSIFFKFFRKTQVCRVGTKNKEKFPKTPFFDDLGNFGAEDGI